LIKSETFASKLSLRFPRIERIRNDKAAVSATTESYLRDDVQRQLQAKIEDSGAGVATAGKRRGRRQQGGAVSKRQKIGEVARPFRPIPGEEQKILGTQLQNCKVHVLNQPKTPGNAPGPGLTRAQLEDLVKSLGGAPYRGYTSAVTHIVAMSSDRQLERFIANHPERDVLRTEWLLRCRESGTLCTPTPADYLYMSKNARESDEIDEYGDDYFLESTPEDVAALIKRHMKAEGLDAPGLAHVLKTPPKHKEGAHVWRVASEALKGELEALRLRDVWPTARTLLVYLDAALRAMNALDVKHCMLHDCVIVVVDLESVEMEASSGKKGGFDVERSILERRDALDSSFGALAVTSDLERHERELSSINRMLQLERIKDAARVLGARVEESMTPYVTHVVAPEESLNEESVANEPELSPSRLLNAVATTAGGSEGVELLSRGLMRGLIQLVSSDMHPIQPYWLNILCT
jgi:hypothetical protein